MYTMSNKMLWKKAAALTTRYLFDKNVTRMHQNILLLFLLSRPKTCLEPQRLFNNYKIGAKLRNP